MESFLIHWGYAAVFLFGFLEAACIPIPSEITFGFAGVLASEGHLSIVGVIVVGTVAELIGSFVSYAVGRAGGRPLVHRFGRYLLITQADVDRAERFVAGRGIWAIPLGRALPVVRTFVSLVAGFIEVPPLLFGCVKSGTRRRAGRPPAAGTRPSPAAGSPAISPVRPVLPCPAVSTEPGPVCPVPRRPAVSTGPGPVRTVPRRPAISPAFSPAAGHPRRRRHGRAGRAG